MQTAVSGPVVPGCDLPASASPHGGSKLQKPAKNLILKIREIDGSYLHLQRFDKFYMWSAATRKRKLCKFAIT
jgi:hypothetical protein